MAKRRGFTLVELLITITIIGIMAGMILFAMFQAQETAKEHKTRALVLKLNSIIMRRYDEYKTRRVPIQFDATELTDPKLMARMRLEVLRDLMRMEMPDRWSDVLTPPASPFNRPAADRVQPPSAFIAYQAKWAAVTGDSPTGPYEYAYDTTKDEYQSAECLYMIVMGTLAQEGDSRDAFKATDVGDVDQDGFPEFIDAWGQPIRFLRWAPGLTSGTQVRGITRPSVNSVAGQTVTVTFDGTQFSTTPGSYVGGVLAVVDPATKHMNGERMGQIVGYQHTGAGGSAIFTCTTPSGEPEPFGGNPPQTSDDVAILNPDPFDSRGIYPSYAYTETETPNFGLIPLIYSAGKDRLYGITSETTPRTEYMTLKLNPCYVHASGFMIGEPSDGYLDNITSHQVTTR
jgi:prepilin-type N-terminal cleavage/methylation domain-containing protein